MNKVLSLKLNDEQIVMLSNLLYDKFAELEGYMYLSRIHRTGLCFETLRDFEHEKDLVNAILIQLELFEHND